MEKLRLVDEGIFPITVDKDGNPAPEMPKTGWNIPGTIQGEGKLAGVPSLFVRLASCNLCCIWELPNGKVSKCDTSYASYNVGTITEWDVEEIASVIERNLKGMHHVVISGGEPLLQAKGLAALCRSIKERTGAHITIESNGTRFDAEVAKFVDLISLSPKLKNSEPSLFKTKALGLDYSGSFVAHTANRLNINAIQQWIDAMRNKGGNIQLKFVVARKHEEDEIKNDYLSMLHGFRNDDVLVMPLGANTVELGQTSPEVLQMAVRNGWRYTPRLHIELFGSKTGV